MSQRSGSDAADAPDSPGWHPPASRSSEDWRRWVDALPMCRDLGLVCVAISDTEVTLMLAQVPLAPNPNGAVNGGIVATVADQAMGVMALRAGPPDQLPATAALHIQFHRPAMAPLTIRGTVLGGGRRVTYIEVVVQDRDGRRCATSQGTMVAGGSGR